MAIFQDSETHGYSGALEGGLREWIRMMDMPFTVSRRIRWINPYGVLGIFTSGLTRLPAKLSSEPRLGSHSGERGLEQYNFSAQR